MDKKPKLFMPLIDNGMRLSATQYAFSLALSTHTVLRDYDVEFACMSWPYPDGAMNMATARFLEGDCDEMIVIDTDETWMPKSLAYLLEHNEPLVFGLYPKKQPGLIFPCNPLPGLENVFVDDGGPALREVAHCARGFMRIHRSVFETMKPHVPIVPDTFSGGEQHEFWRCMPGGHSEDFAFSEKWRSLGGKILVDRRILVQHQGPILFPIPGTYVEPKKNMEAQDKSAA